MIAKYLKRLPGSIAIAGLSFALAYPAFAQPRLSTGTSVNVGQPSSTQLSRDEINQQEAHDELEENTHHDGIQQGINSKDRAEDITHDLRIKQLEAAQTPYKSQHIADENERHADAKKEIAEENSIEAQRHAQALARIEAAAQALLSGAASALGNALNGGGGSPSGAAPQPNGGGSASNPNSGGSASNPSSGGGSPGNRAYPGGAPGGVPNNPALGGSGAPAGNPNSGGSTASNPNGGGSSSNPNGGGGPSNNPNAGGGSPGSPRLAGGTSSNGSGAPNSSSNPNNNGGSASNPNVGSGSPNNPYSGGASASNPNSGGGSPGNPNAGGGSPSNPRLTGNASSSPNSGGNSPSNPSAGNGSPNNPYSGSASASNPNNGGGSSGNPNAGSGSPNSPQLTGNASSNANASNGSSSGPGNATPGEGLLHPLVAMANWWAKMTQPPSSQGTGKPYTGPLAVNGRSLAGIVNDGINKVVDAIPGAAGALQRINQAVGGYAKSQQNEWTQQQTPEHQVAQVASAALFNSAFQAAGGGAGALKQQLQQSLSQGAGVTGAMAAVVAKNGRDNIGKAMLNGAVSDARAIFGPTANKLFPRTGLASGGNGEPVVSNGSGGSNPPLKTGVTETGDPGANTGGEPNGQGGAPSNGTNQGKPGSSGPKPAEYPAARPATLRGMTAKTDQTLQQIAKKKGWTIFTRDSNPGAARFIGQPGYVPKPQYIKLKSTPYDPSVPLYEQPNAGLVTTKGAPPAEVQALEAQGYQVDGDGILSKDGNRFYSDVDLHGVYDAAGNDAFPQFLQELTKPEYNDDSYLQWLVQHSSHDGWLGRNDLKIAGSNVGPQAGNGKSVTAYTPNSQASLDSIAQLRRFYMENNIDFDRLYPGYR